jgi:hypothetical protein
MYHSIRASKENVKNTNGQPGAEYRGTASLMESKTLVTKVNISDE